MDDEDGEKSRGLTARLAKTNAKKNTYGKMRHCMSRRTYSQMLGVTKWGMSTHG